VTGAGRNVNRNRELKSVKKDVKRSVKRNRESKPKSDMG
jgi:hypothetical protein